MKRKNAGKPRLSIPARMTVAMAAIADIMAASEEKYGPAEDEGWRGYRELDTIDSLLRHTAKRLKGEMIDSESGRPHSHHILANAAILVEIEAMARAGVVPTKRRPTSPTRQRTPRLR